MPNLVENAVERWELKVDGPVPNLSYNYVALARRKDGSDCILKIGVPNPELTSEIAALCLYGGQGACRLLEADPQAGMMVLERLRPGRMLHESGSDEEQTTIAAKVMKRLWKPAPAGVPLISLRGWFDELGKLRPHFGGGNGPFPKELVETVESTLPDLFKDTEQAVVLHGDCHHFNILSSERGWLVIDPKGVIGAAEYEPAALLLNPWGDLARMPGALEMTRRRIQILGDELGLDRKRILAWAVCHSLLSAWWDWDEKTASGGQYSAACGELFLKVKV